MEGYLRSNLARDKVPCEVVFAASVPRTTAGKLRRTDRPWLTVAKPDCGCGSKQSSIGSRWIISADGLPVGHPSTGCLPSLGSAERASIPEVR